MVNYLGDVFPLLSYAAMFLESQNGELISTYSSVSTLCCYVSGLPEW